MADRNMNTFEDRLDRIKRDHRGLASGYVRLEERNGTIVPVRKVRARHGFPWRGLFLVLLAFVVFKSMLFSMLGPVRYVEHHARLEQGTVVERMGAWALRPDPATIYLSEKITPFIPKGSRITAIGS